MRTLLPLSAFFSVALAASLSWADPAPESVSAPDPVAEAESTVEEPQWDPFEDPVEANVRGYLWLNNSALVGAFFVPAGIALMALAEANGWTSSIRTDPVTATGGGLAVMGGLMWLAGPYGGAHTLNRAGYRTDATASYVAFALMALGAGLGVSEQVSEEGAAAIIGAGLLANAVQIGVNSASFMRVRDEEQRLLREIAVTPTLGPTGLGAQLRVRF